MQQIGHGIFQEDSYLGVTIGALVFSHGLILIDSPLRPEDSRAWRSTLVNQRGGANRMLVSLDAHPDRTLGTRTMESTIVSHQKAAQVFRNRPTIFKGQSVESGAIWETYADAIGMRWASPDITFTDRMSLHWGGPEIILDYQPGPTSGSIWVIIPDARVVFTGDSVILNQPPFLAQADLGAWQASLDYLINNYSGFTIVSGRGGLATGDDVHKLRQTLKDVETTLESLAVKNAIPEATQELIPALLSNYTFPVKLRDLYAVRLRYGLYQCFARRFRPSSALAQGEVEYEEQ
jgi:glyoxylase-like metal-dependent hydrolase (beta-lactamase superfamily II)